MYSGEEGFRTQILFVVWGVYVAIKLVFFPVCRQGCERRVAGCIASRHDQVST